jgi:hypothetical protein
MLKNYIDSDYIKQLFPDIDTIRSKEETDSYLRVKDSAEQEVRTDFINIGKDVTGLRPENYLIKKTTKTENFTSEAVLEEKNRFRIVINILASTVVGENVKNKIIIQGSYDNELFYNAYIVQFGNNEVKIFTDELDSFKYFKLSFERASSGSSAEFEIFLTETIYDHLYRYKWLEMIFRNKRRVKDDRFDILVTEMNSLYNSLIQSGKFLYDVNDGSGESEIVSTSHKRIER